MTVEPIRLEDRSANSEAEAGALAAHQHFHTPMPGAGGNPPHRLRLAVWQVGMLLLGFISVLAVLVGMKMAELSGRFSSFERYTEALEQLRSEQTQQIDQRLQTAETTLGIRIEEDQPTTPSQEPPP